jgi:23S rRNA (uracil1939-C5)-methyltransferase
MRPRRGSRSAPAETIELRIDKLVYGGAGLGRHEGKVVFVPFTAPGDRVRARVVERKKNFLRAALVEVLEPGPERQAPPCRYFGDCGGCQWQQLAYPAQVEAKRRILEELFHHRFAETRALEIRMRASPREFGYRSRARIQLRGFGEQAKVGFYHSQSHRVVDVESCPLLRPELDRALGSIRSARREFAADPGLRAMEIAASAEEGTWGAAAVEEESDEGLAAARTAETHEAEEPVLRRRIGGMTYAFTPSLFFQANDYLVGELVELVVTLARAGARKSALDLYAGVGLFTLPLAREFERVAAVERSPAAARFCASNAADAGLGNVEVVCADAAAWTEAAGSMTPPWFDLVLLDPPRAGCAPALLERLAAWSPATILYVSCDPNTLVRDMAILAARGYAIDHIEGLDLFPQSYHFEAVVRLRLR